MISEGGGVWWGVQYDIRGGRGVVGGTARERASSRGGAAGDV